MKYKKLNNEEVNDFIMVLRDYMHTVELGLEMEKELQETWYKEYLNNYKSFFKKPKTSDEFWCDVFVYVSTMQVYKVEKLLKKYTSFDYYSELLIRNTRSNSDFYDDVKRYISNLTKFGDMKHFELNDDVVKMYNKCIMQTIDLKRYIDIVNKKRA